jgi:hypothetical protein
MTPDPVALVSIRRDQIAFNAHFVAIAHLEEFSHVSVFAAPQLFRLGLQFHPEAPDEDAIALTNDGGSSRGRRGRCIQVAGLMRDHPWLAAVARIEDPRLRRFEPKWLSTDSMWVISLCPAFEHRVSDRSDIPTRDSGIYCYKRGDEIVYIGRGQIRSRLGANDREEWDFETIEYSLVSDEAEQVKWEAFWLDRFVEQHGKLPIYNRISGKRPT